MPPVEPERRRGPVRARPDLAAGTRRVIRPSGPPTDELPLLVTPDGVDPGTARAVIDLAMRAGVALLATGAPAADVVATVLMLTRAYGLASVHVDVTFTSVGVSYHRGPHADPMTVIRAVPRRTQDYTRLERLRGLVNDLAASPVPVEEARVRFDALVRAPHPYRRWLVSGASAVLASAVAILIGAGPLVTALTFVSALIVDRLQYVLTRARVAAFFSQVLGAAVPTALATMVVVAGSRGIDLAARASPSLIVASGIVLLLSGLSVVGAAEDALEGYYVTAGAKAFEVVVLTLGIAIGVTAVLSIGARLGVPVAVSARTELDRNLALQLGCAAVIAGAFALSAYARGRVILVSAVLGALGWAAYSWLESAVAMGASVSSAIAAGLIGLLARPLSRRLGTGVLPLTTSGIVPLLPGRAVYQGISEVITSGNDGLLLGLSTLAGAAFTGLGLAAGVALGSSLARLLSAWGSAAYRRL